MDLKYHFPGTHKYVKNNNYIDRNLLSNFFLMNTHFYFSNKMRIPVISITQHLYLCCHIAIEGILEI